MSFIYEAVKSADNRFVTVTVVQGSHQHGSCCYGPGDEFTVPYAEGKCFLDEDALTEQVDYSCPFHPYCTDGDINSKPVAGAYRDMYVLQAGVPKEICVPVDGSCCPAYAHFTICGGCFYANYGVGSVTPAALPSVDVVDGTAMDMNPAIRTLADAEGNQIDKISVVSDSDGILQVEYFGA